jgi:signal transduction histidine kinase/CheY-like chemotaxis protein
MVQPFNSQKEITTAKQVGEYDGVDIRASRDTALQAAREAVRDTTRLTRLLSILNDSGQLHSILDRGLSTLSELFLADVVVLLDPVGTGSFSPLAAIGLPEDILCLPFSNKEGSLMNLLLSFGRPVNIKKIGSGQEIDSQLVGLGVETLIGLPVDGNDAVRGALILARCQPAPFSETDAGLLKTMAYRIGRTLIEAQQSFQFEKIVRSSRQINRHLDFGAVAGEAVKTFPIIISADAAALILRDPSGELYCAAQTGLHTSCSAAINLLAKHMIASSFFGENDLYNTADMDATLEKFSLHSLELPPMEAFLAVPITYKDTFHGILFGFRFSAIAYNFGTSQIAVLYAEQVATALENSGLYQAVQKELIERKRLEEEKGKWERQQQQLQKTRSLDRMAGAIAHHFNNQLAVVIGNLEMAIEDTSSDNSQVRLMTAALQGANKAAEVSGLMLTYLGQTTGKFEALNLSEICRKNLPLLEASAPKFLSLKMNLPPLGPIIRANPNQIQQILTHLVTNALEAVAENHGAVGFTVKTASSAGIPVAHRFPIDWQPQDIVYACLEIWDTGCGIARDDIEKLFDPFFSSKFTGRGLGLPVVLGIVKAHDGVVIVESEVGQGSSFKVFFPLAAQEVTGLAVNVPQTSALAVSGKVLLVEDDELVREMAAIMLANLGFTVHTASDGVEALAVFKKHLDEIRLVLSDVSMPRMDGWKTLKALRQIRPNIPVILASGHDESQVLAGEHLELPQVFLHKPYQMVQLRDALAKAMAMAAIQ